ncbi:dihydrofolate reductase family protein [Streptococcus sp. NLN64]|uniref:dihydrofolate reductase family protein n=1 Tax=Streptococcus sp. NLN64 TaxID=2822799 RepID=UPI0018CBE873|nr:dihydrofolate reductase family protein [Streptococcus sp. NLN64]MBG9366996.1 dihydrofolate reductase [Streptococcus sp. NLN64]
MKRELVLNLAVSLDGYVAREDGSYDWIQAPDDSMANTALQFDNAAFFESCDTVVLGHRSFLELGLDEIPGAKEKQFLVARRGPEEKRDNVHFTPDVVSSVKELLAEEGGPIWLFGGAQIADSLIAEDLVSEYILGVVPVILGKGRRLFDQTLPEISLKLVESAVTDGIALLRYRKADT